MDVQSRGECLGADLVDLDGLSSLERASFRVRILDNLNLQSVQGLWGVDTSSIYIWGNNRLCQTHAEEAAASTAARDVDVSGNTGGCP